MKRCGTTDDVQALEEIMTIAALEPDDLEEARDALGEILELAAGRIKGDEKPAFPLERVRSAAWAYVNAPQKFGIRRSAYRALVKALDDERNGRRE